MKNPKISIVVPVYNVEKYLSECLDSIVNQTFKDIEIICVNDGSTDNSLKILEEYALKDERIIVFSQENQGHSGSRNTGIRLAKGEYIGFVDSDDFISDFYFQYLYEAIIQHNADIAFTDNILRDKNGKFYKKYLNVELDLQEKLYEMTPDVVSEIFYNCVVWSKLYKTSLIKENDISFVPKLKYEDIYFYHAVMLNAKKVVKINKSIYFYRNNPTGTINISKKPNNFDMIKNFEIIYKLFESKNLLGIYNLPFSILTFRSSQNSDYKAYRAEVLKMLKRLNIKKRNINEPKVWALLFSPNRFIYGIIKYLLIYIYKK